MNLTEKEIDYCQNGLIRYTKKYRKYLRNEHRKERNLESDRILYYGMRLLFGNPPKDEFLESLNLIMPLTLYRNPNLNEFIYCFIGKKMEDRFRINTMIAFDTNDNWDKLSPIIHEFQKQMHAIMNKELLNHENQPEKNT